MMGEAIVCPLCTGAEMEYTKIKNAKREEASHPEETNVATHAWSCPECPGLLMEWLDPTDTETLHEHLKGELRPHGE